MLTHRDLKGSDLAEICCFPQSAEEVFYMFPAASHPLTEQQLAEAAQKRQGSTVVLRDGRIAGYANFFKCVKGEICDLGNVVVNPEFRRKGVASYLIEVMSQKAVEEFQAGRLQASCFNQNTTGLIVYHALGFKPVRLEICKNPGGFDVMLIHLEKDL